MTQPLGANQERWLRVLESGDFDQGYGFLQDNNGKYCCLGVGCGVVIAAGQKMCITEDVDEGVTEYDGWSTGAPPKLVTFLALYSSEGRSRDRHKPGLTDLNDAGGLSFSDVAKLIREDPSVYFSEPR